VGAHLGATSFEAVPWSWRATLVTGAKSRRGQVRSHNGRRPCLWDLLARQLGGHGEKLSRPRPLLQTRFVYAADATMRHRIRGDDDGEP